MEMQNLVQKQEQMVLPADYHRLQEMQCLSAKRKKEY
jgi:hypothetical protein